jgi:hypothetical protein
MVSGFFIFRLFRGLNPNQTIAEQIDITSNNHITQGNLNRKGGIDYDLLQQPKMMGVVAA